MITLQFGVVRKKRNSTYVPQDSELTAIQYASLKDGCSDHNPVFLLNNANNVFAFNYVKWDNWYYFIDDVVRERNQLVSVHCTLDVLATYKSEILQTTAFVSYSSVSGGSWLPDTRIPILNNVSVSSASVRVPFLWEESTLGAQWFYLTVIGKTGGCATWALTYIQLRELINHVSRENDNIMSDIQDLIDDGDPTSAIAYGLGKTNLYSNAYSSAVNCIRACRWSRFEPTVISTGNVFLGDYDTEISGRMVDISPDSGTLTVSIPWQYSDWRRASAEDIYLFIPCVGMVSINSENIVNATSLTIKYAYTVLDGNVVFKINAGDQIIGTYAGNASGDFPIGINRSASSQEIFQSLIQGAEKTIATAAQANIINPLSFGAVAGQAVLTGIDVKTAANQKHPTCIGGMGGGAGTILSQNIVCFSVAHGTSCTPDEMAAVMGKPTMKPLTLSQCTGYCECVNAHVALSASTDAISEVDQFINTGFYIE